MGKLFLHHLGVIDGLVADLHENLYPEAVHRDANGINVALAFYEPIDPAVLLDVQRAFVLGSSAEGENGEYDDQQKFFHFFSSLN